MTRDSVLEAASRENRREVVSIVFVFVARIVRVFMVGWIRRYVCLKIRWFTRVCYVTVAIDMVKFRIVVRRVVSVGTVVVLERALNSVVSSVIVVQAVFRYVLVIVSDPGHVIVVSRVI